LIVCLCNAIDDQTVNRAIADGAETVDQIAESCGAGDNCGGCREFIGEMIEAHARRRQLPILAPVFEPA
jgi:bacterioferritin-associated ferredoxin